MQLILIQYGVSFHVSSLEWKKTPLENSRFCFGMSCFVVLYLRSARTIFYHFIHDNAVLNECYFAPTILSILVEPFTSQYLISYISDQLIYQLINRLFD